MEAIKHWLVTGTPAGWVQVLAVLAYAFVEWVLPRTKALAANSAVELVANMVKPMLGKVPLVGKIVAALATPEVKSIVQPDARTKQTF